MTDIEIDYDLPAELFIPKRGARGRRQTINYRRFATAAEAIQFAPPRVMNRWRSASAPPRM